MNSRNENPKTGTVYYFPRDAKKYLAQVHRKSTTQDGAEACEHGHHDCALWEGGPCENEIDSSISLPPQPTAKKSSNAQRALEDALMRISDCLGDMTAESFECDLADQGDDAVDDQLVLEVGEACRKWNERTGRDDPANIDDEMRPANWKFSR